MRLILAACLLFAVAHSRIEFDHTILYDMYDFKGNYVVEVTDCELGCRVYLSYPLDEWGVNERTIGQFTIVLEDKTFITFTKLRTLQLDTGEKGYFAVPIGTMTFTINNPNGNGAATALALLLVKNNAPNINAIQIYEASGTKNAVWTTGKRISIMNVSPFIVYAKFDGPFSLTVKTSPFDMLDNKDCEYVYKRKSDVGVVVALPVNSPVISLLFAADTIPRFQLSSEIAFPYDRSIEETSYVAAPGYIGCWNKTFIFRNELYNDFELSGFNETFVVEGDNSKTVHFYGDINTDDSEPIRLYNLEKDEDPVKISGMQNEHVPYIYQSTMTTSRFQVFWDGTRFRNASFMLRYEIDAGANLPVTSIVTFPGVEPTTSSANLLSLFISSVVIAIARVL